MAIIKKKVVNDFWTTKPYSGTLFFGRQMPLWKFFLIRRTVHLNNNENEFPRIEEGFDLSANVHYVIYDMNNLFKKC